LAADEHQGWSDRSLKHAEENAGNKKGSIAGGSSTTGDSDAPEDDIDPQPFGRGEDLK
jgi:hypothetical protein